jgi:hypothetical protein
MARAETLPFDVDAWLNDEELSRCSPSRRSALTAACAGSGSFGV